MISVLVNWILSAIAILVTASLVPGFKIDSFTTALIVALILGIFNAIIKPILVILTLPINILTLGLFTFVLNAILILLVDKIVAGFSVSEIGSALIAAVVLWLINLVVSFILFPIKAL